MAAMIVLLHRTSIVACMLHASSSSVIRVARSTCYGAHGNLPTKHYASRVRNICLP